MLGLIAKAGPPFNAVKRCPATVKPTVTTLPGGRPLGFGADSG
jgi:hypothetical protein